jgi:hypothetical protein
VQSPRHSWFDHHARETTTAVRAPEPAPAVTPATRVGAGVVFFVALLAIVYLYRRLQARARLEEAEALLDAELRHLDHDGEGSTPTVAAPARTDSGR